MGRSSNGRSGPNHGSKSSICSSSDMIREVPTPGVVRNTSCAARVCASNSASGAEMRTVEVCANSLAQRSAKRPVASDSASANTARNAIAPAVKVVSVAVKPVGGTTLSAARSPVKRSLIALKYRFTDPPPPAATAGP